MQIGDCPKLYKHSSSMASLQSELVANCCLGPSIETVYFFSTNQNVSVALIIQNCPVRFVI